MAAIAIIVGLLGVIAGSPRTKLLCTIIIVAALVAYYGG